MSTAELKEKKIVSTVLDGIAVISCQEELTKEDAISQIMAMKPVKRVFTYRLDRKGNTILGVVISLSPEEEPTRDSAFVVEDIALHLN